MNFKIVSIGLLASMVLASCNSGSSSASTPAPDVKTNGCYPESELMKAGIVGGEKVANYDVDAKKVVLLFAEDDEGRTSICTSTAIAPNVLLTAAHCISKHHYVVFHSSISCESGFDPQQHLARVRGVVKNADWSEDSKDLKNTATDVAIVILEKNIPSSYRVMKIANPDEVNFQSGLVRFIGYGVTDYEGGGSGILRKTEFSITNVEVDKEMNVVGVDQSNGSGVCSGDSGGPSLVTVNGEEQILGVNSVVSGKDKENLCRDKSFQTLASGHIPWIKKALAKFGMNINL